MQPPALAAHADLQRNLLAFCRLLRHRDLLVTPSEVVDSLRTAEAVDLTDRTELKLALRSVLTARPQDVPVFDATFDEFWRVGRSHEGGDDHFTTRDTAAHGAGQDQPRAVDAPRADADRIEEERDGTDAPRYSPIEVLARRNFGTFEPNELADIARAIVLVARRLATRESRRYRVSRHGRALDLRRTLRRNIKYGGTVLELAHKQRRIRKPRIVLVCDVSRSMAAYSQFLLQFIYGLQHVLGRVDSFVFSTRLTRVSHYFRGPDIYGALDRMSREVPDWSGGTRIGDSLASLNRAWALRLLDRHTIVVILSDGLDSGDASVLGAEMGRIRARVARVIWLNPLLGDPNYRPVARAMRAALPHIDVFAAAHNLASLQALAAELKPV